MKPTTFVICVVAGILLGWWFVIDCQRYNERYDAECLATDSEHWSLACWKRWKAEHWDKPQDEKR